MKSPPVQTFSSLPKTVKWLSITSAILLLIVISLSVIAYRQLQKEVRLWEESTQFTVRQIAQLQREVLRFSIIVHDVNIYSSDEILLQQNLVESRVNILVRNLSTNNDEFHERVQTTEANWHSLDSFIKQWQENPQDSASTKTLIQELETFELSINQFVADFNNWRIQHLTQRTRNLQQLFIMSQGAILLLFVVIGVTVINVLKIIQELKQTESALRLSEKRYALATNAGQISVWDQDFQTKTVYIDPNLQKLIVSNIQTNRYSVEEWLKFIHPNDKQKVMYDIQQYVEGNEDQFESEYRLLVIEGKPRWMLARATISRDIEGNPIRMIGTHTDITERKEVELNLQQSQRLQSISLLAGGISHDFNNILTGIMGQHTLALMKLPPNSSARIHIEKATKSAQRAADLTKQLLAYAGKGQPTMQTLDLNDLLKENRELFELAMPKKVSLSFHLAPQILPVEIDKAQIQQIIMNLIINGAESIGNNISGKIRILTKQTTIKEEKGNSYYMGTLSINEPYVCLEINDTGVGMSQSIMNQIFDPFFSTKENGRGLGLSATLGIVQSHNGALKVSSKLGKGSCFTIFLPLSKKTITNEEEQIVPIASKKAINNAPDTVLVIEDEEPVRELVTDILEIMNVNVLSAINGEDGIKQFITYRSRIALVLLDMQMPVMNGLETLKALRQYDPHIKVILSSGYSEHEASQLFENQQPTAFLQKPYTHQALIQTVQYVLGLETT